MISFLQYKKRYYFSFFVQNQNLPDLNIEYNNQRNIKIATPNPISMAGRFQRRVDFLLNAEPMIRPIMMMLKESNTILNESRLLIESNFVKNMFSSRIVMAIRIFLFCITEVNSLSCFGS